MPLKSKIPPVIQDTFLDENEKNHLLCAVRKPVHAYLFLGADTRFLADVAQRFYSALVCPFGGCGKCPVCAHIFTETHPDFVRVYPEGQNILVEQAREIIHWAYEKPIEAQFRFIIIDEAHLMNTETSNTLLKVIEEPPPATIFVLLAESETQLLETVVSRTSRLRFSGKGRTESRLTKASEAARMIAETFIEKEGWLTLEETIFRMIDEEVSKVEAASKERLSKLKEIGVDSGYLSWLEKLENSKLKRVQRRMSIELVAAMIGGFLEIVNEALMLKAGILDIKSEEAEVYDLAKDLSLRYSTVVLMNMQELLLEGNQLLRAGVSSEQLARGLILKLWKVSKE